MLTGIAVITHGPSHNFDGASIFVALVLLVIVVIFIRAYGGRGRR